MAKKVSKNKPARRALMTFSSHEVGLFPEFYVEESNDGRRWRRIPEGAGPYTSPQVAMGVAHAYSLAHHVRTRVVGVS